MSFKRFDLFKPFKTCCFCKGKSNLLRLGDYPRCNFFYYHKTCLDEHLSSHISNIPARFLEAYRQQQTFFERSRSILESMRLCHLIQEEIISKKHVNSVKLNKFQEVFGE